MVSSVAMPSTISHDDGNESLTPMSAAARQDPPSAASSSASTVLSAPSRLDPFVAFLFPSSDSSTWTRESPKSTTWPSAWENHKDSKKRSACKAGLKTSGSTKLARTLSFNSSRQQQDDSISVSELVDEVVTDDLCKEEKKCLSSGLKEPVAVRSNLLLEMLPQEIVDYCCQFLDPVTDRASASSTCRSFRDSFRGPALMRATNLLGNNHDVRCYFTPDDDAEDVLKKVEPFLQYDNRSALYISGMIHLYAKDEMETGVRMLERSAKKGHEESLFSLGLVYRDMDSEKSADCMKRAYALGSFSAQMEIMQASDLRDQVGEPNAQVLRQWMGSLTLHKLLRKCFAEQSRFRALPSSHCWNPTCGRWAYKSPKDKKMVTRIKCARMKMCSSCRRAKYCSKICQVYDWRSGRHKFECQFIG